MDDSSTAARSLRPAFFPFGFALVSVTALVSSNPHEGILSANLIIPSGIALLVALVGWLVGSLLSRRRAGQNLIALAFVATVLPAGYLFGWLRNLFSAEITPYLQVMASAVLFIAVVPFVRRLPEASVLPRFLNVTSAILLTFSLPALLRLGEQAPSIPPPTHAILALSDTAPRPDIYLVTLDGYSGSASLSAVYGFDNTSIQDSLRSRGFRIPSAPEANYVKTVLSVGSMLNRKYADEVMAAAAPAFTDWRPAYRVLEFNQTTVDLKAAGYSFFYVGSPYPPMARNRLADDVGTMPISREFERLWLRSTIIGPALAAWRLMSGDGRSQGPFQADDAGATEARLAQFKVSVANPRPKFVFMHLLMPHEPFRFGPDCEPLQAEWLTDAEAPTPIGRGLFVDQVRCTNRKIIEMVDAIRETSGDSAVILLQADHGHGRFSSGVPLPLGKAAPDQVRERFDVFAAYAGPEDVADSLASVRTPVNLFRTLFRVLWSVDEPPLPDRHYWSNPSRPLDLVEVGSEMLE